MTQTKTCTVCSAEKTLDAFHAKRNGKYGVSSWCKDCCREYHARRYESGEGKEYFRKYNAARNTRPEMREYYRSHNAAYYLGEGIAARKREQQRAILSTPEGKAAHCARGLHRRARLQTAARTLTPEDWKAAVTALSFRCAYCGVSLDCIPGGRHEKKPNGLSLDHVVPLSAGGHHTPYNTLPCCFRCNVRKGTMVLGEFLERSGFDQQEVAERISKATWQLASGEDAARWELQGSDSLAWAS